LRQKWNPLVISSKVARFEWEEVFARTADLTFSHGLDPKAKVETVRSLAVNTWRIIENRNRLVTEIQRAFKVSQALLA
jgi:hypothetical protein